MFTSIALRRPHEIDGSPDEVAAIVRTDMAELAVAVEAYVETALIQIKNAELSALLAADPAMDAEALAQAYARSASPRRLDMLRRATKLFSAAARGV